MYKQGYLEDIHLEETLAGEIGQRRTLVRKVKHLQHVESPCYPC